MLNPRSSVPYNIFHSKTNPVFIFQSEHLSCAYASTNCAVDRHLYVIKILKSVNTNLKCLFYIYILSVAIILLSSVP